MKLVLIKGSGEIREFRLHDGINTIGRGVTNRIRLLDPGVSRRHCRIRKLGLSLFLSDLGTKNGTHVNGQSVKEQELKLFDEIKIGKTILKLVEQDYPSEMALQTSEPGFLRNLLNFFLRRKYQPAEQAGNDFARFARKSRKKIWRPRLDTDPPEAHVDTAFSHTDPDS
ncbi:MAG: FHA domain-containing protein [Candidatus Abyssobacteria bacterium SURF_5]|uniref:FHA domain-containing protein n=1 Tax=Abyssobacteria bacterium (strain SURF_5) TaxID=2093360 RepID=A0A3A4NJ92_ABYX5|nr:MAG: FHA domain-containing protein [Candidatus Abyssubacteria bacterium SURF_5]